LTSVKSDPLPWRSPRTAWVALASVGVLLLAAFGLVVAALSKRPQATDEGPTDGPPQYEISPAGRPPHPPDKCPRHSRDEKLPSTTPGENPNHTPAIEDVRPRPRPGGFEAPGPLAVPEFVTRDVEVVFCIDTTGSMGGLLAGAKQKIWAICNQIASGRPVPHLKVGLVAYKDKGDEYVTRVFDLSRDLDAMYSELQGLTAGGGGDEPESVNQALDDAVNRVRWSTDKKTLRIIFLVGDAPPHMDYTDDVKYPQTCRKAVQMGIIINTIQCGTSVDCMRAWKDIASKAGGACVAIPQSGGVLALKTPFDKDLARVGSELLDTALLYGDAERRRRGERTLATARRLTGPAAADRAAFAAKSKRISPYDLLDDIRSRRVKLADVTIDRLPNALARLKTLAERQMFLDLVEARREKLRKEAVALEKKRSEFLKDATARRKHVKEGFDLKVLEVLRKQAGKFDIEY
jgi:hypothetical protein